MTQTAARPKTQTLSFNPVHEIVVRKPRPNPPANLLLWACKIEWRSCEFQWLSQEVLDRYEPGAVGYYSYAVDMGTHLHWGMYTPPEFEQVLTPEQIAWAEAQFATIRAQ